MRAALPLFQLKKKGATQHATCDIAYTQLLDYCTRSAVATLLAATCDIPKISQPRLAHRTARAGTSQGGRHRRRHRGGTARRCRTCTPGVHNRTADSRRPRRRRQEAGRDEACDRSSRGCSIPPGEEALSEPGRRVTGPFPAEGAASTALQCSLATAEARPRAAGVVAAHRGGRRRARLKCLIRHGLEAITTPGMSFAMSEVK